MATEGITNLACLMQLMLAEVASYHAVADQVACLVVFARTVILKVVVLAEILVVTAPAAYQDATGQAACPVAAVSAVWLARRVGQVELRRLVSPDRTGEEGVRLPLR